MTTIIKPISDPAKQPKTLAEVPKPERKTTEHCEFCRKVREAARRLFLLRRRRT